MAYAWTVQMFKPVRVVATIVFIASIIMVFVGAFVINSDVRFVTPLIRATLTNRRALTDTVHQYAFSLCCAFPLTDFPS